MTVRDVDGMFRSWAPPGIAWERDNVGLQVGSHRARVKGILVALEVTDGVLAEARRRGANLVVTHHPLLFHPVRTLTDEDRTAGLVLHAGRAGLNVYSAHTNLDFTRDGTSFALAARLGLRAARFLATPYHHDVKIVTFVPAGAVERIAAALAAAGAGRIGGYTECSFRVPGTGTFRGGRDTRPAVGEAGRREAVDEVRLEMVADRHLLAAALDAVRRSHPYEEPAIDVYPLEGASSGFGQGAIGVLPRPVSLETFLRRVKKQLGSRALRFTRGTGTSVSTVAVCGGAGSDLLAHALRVGADAFVTADVKYHTFHEAAGRIALVDAGHYETEAPVLHTVAARLRSLARRHRAACSVRLAGSVTNPIACM